MFEPEPPIGKEVSQWTEGPDQKARRTSERVSQHLARPGAPGAEGKAPATAELLRGQVTRCTGLMRSPGRAGISGFRIFRAAQGTASEGFPVGTTCQAAQGLLQGILGRNTCQAAQGLLQGILGRNTWEPLRWLSPSLGVGGGQGCGQSHTNVGLRGKRSLHRLS